MELFQKPNLFLTSESCHTVGLGLVVLVTDRRQTDTWFREGCVSRVSNRQTDGLRPPLPSALCSWASSLPPCPVLVVAVWWPPCTSPLLSSHPCHWANSLRYSSSLMFCLERVRQSTQLFSWPWLPAPSAAAPLYVWDSPFPPLPPCLFRDTPSSPLHPVALNPEITLFPCLFPHRPCFHPSLFLRWPPL